MHLLAVVSFAIHEIAPFRKVLRLQLTPVSTVQVSVNQSGSLPSLATTLIQPQAMEEVGLKWWQEKGGDLFHSPEVASLLLPPL